MKRKILLFLLLPLFCAGQQNDNKIQQASASASSEPNGKRPDIANIKYEDIKFAKSEGNVFWFYYKPTQYFFNNNEFETITLENKDILVYIHELERYVLLAGYGDAEKEKEYSVQPVANSHCVFIRSDLSGYWIFDKGLRVPDLYVSNSNRIASDLDREYVLRSAATDRRYIVDMKDFKFARLNTPIGIASE